MASSHCRRFLPLILLLIGLYTLIPSVQPARILSVSFVASKSHLIAYRPLLEELANRGHDVTALSPFTFGQRKNLREIQTLPEDVDRMMDDMQKVYDGHEISFPDLARFFGKACADDLPQVQAVAKEKFDLIILEPLFNECAAAWVHAFNTSLVLVITAPAPNYITAPFGNPTPPSFIPNFLSGFLADEMSFMERVQNLLLELTFRLSVIFFYIPHMDGIFKEKMPDTTLTSSDELYRNASLLLAHSHFSVSSPRPYLPDIIEVGGLHCRPAKALPKDLDDWLNASGSDGFIFFSMGSALKGSIMPEHRRKMFLNTFSKLKQRVLWKWETEHMDDLPKNVKLSKWLPQQDVLGHPKIKAFITHGGLGGTMEALYHGVPLIGLPMYGDQNMNMMKAKHAGYAVALDFTAMTEETLGAAIQEVVTQPKYRDRIKELSTLFRDTPDTALDRAVYWVEYVIRHKGATHLRSAARNLKFIQYHSIDVIGFLATVIGTMFFMVLTSLRWVWRKMCGAGRRRSSAKAGRGAAEKNGKKHN